MYRRADGIVDFDKSICIGCKACIAACPYDAIFINPQDHSAEKCNFCAHRLDMGLEPACVVVCPTEAILVGDMHDPLSAVSAIIYRDAVTVRRPEKETRPKLFYKGADQVTLDPLAAKRPEGGLFLWSEQGAVSNQVPSGHPGPWNNSAAAVLSYDVIHRAPWDYRVSLYTFTKSIAAGAYLAPLLLALAGWLPWGSPLWTTVGPVVALVFLVLTTAILIWDLEHPTRFWMVVARPNWDSWLVRGGFVLTGFGAILAGHVAATLSGRDELARMLAWAGGPLSLLTAVYTAYLFAQAKARDLWQSSLLAPHLLVQAVVAGAGTLALIPWAGSPPVLRLFIAGGVIHVLLGVAEVSTPHPTAHATLAVRAMTRGPYAWFYWGGLALTAGGAAALSFGVGAWTAAVVLPALMGLLAYEHAFVQAGQSVPLA
jgi:ferredoxin/formate-dependent nitrite reductase membrane component NrfD